MSGPYAEGAPRYWDAGWRSVLPLPPLRKANPPDDYTGWKGTLVPSWPDVMSWIETKGNGNICLRLPLGVLGIDVDDYDGKIGGQTFARCAEKWGPLPATWMSTSREGVSGIRLFRVPVLRGEHGEARSLAWPGKIGPGIESIHYGHRYMLVSPSIHDKTGQTYRWFTPDGVPSPSSAPPRIADLAELPTAWVVGLTQGREAHTYQGAGMDDAEIRGWLEGHWGGVPCTPMSDVADRLLEEMHDGAHESLRLLMRLVGMAAAGHSGLREVLGTVRKKFIAEVTSRRGDEQTAAEEWTRSLFGAVDNIVGEMAKTGTASSTVDPCERLDEALVSPAPAATATTASSPLGDVLSAPAPGSVQDASEEPSDDNSLDIDPQADPQAGDEPGDEGEYQPRELTEEELAELAAARRETEIGKVERDLEIRHEAQQRLLAKTAPPFHALGYAAFRAGAVPEPLVDSLLYRDSLSRIYGAPGCGKSFLALDLAFHVAMGRPWGNQEARQGRVAYVMAEGQRVNNLRAQAWQERHGVTDDELEGRFYAVPDALALTEAAIGPFVAWVAQTEIDLVILDTKNAMQVGEENSATDAAIMRRALDAIRKATNACVVLIDHTGKHDAESARGSSAVKAAMDTEIRVSNDGGQGGPPLVTIEVTRDKADDVTDKRWERVLRHHPLEGGRSAAVLLELDADVEMPTRRRGDEDAWQEGESAAVPTELLHYEGEGGKALPDLARWMAYEASRTIDSDGVGKSFADAARTFKGQHGRNTVHRAWLILRKRGDIEEAEGVKNPNGRHIWTR